MRKCFIYCLLVFLACACSDKDQLPKGVLHQQQMREILWDMIRAGEFLNAFVINKDSSVNKVAESEKWYNKIYQMHKTSKAEFEKSYHYYSDHPDLMKELLDSLSKRQISTLPLRRDSTFLKDSMKFKRDSNQTRDTIRKPSDIFRKKNIKKRKDNIKAV